MGNMPHLKYRWREGFRFFYPRHWDDVGVILAEVDPYDLLMELLKERVRLQKRTGDVSIIKEFGGGQKVRFTQRQSRAKLFYMEKG